MLPILYIKLSLKPINNINTLNHYYYDHRYIIDHFYRLKYKFNALVRSTNKQNFTHPIQFKHYYCFNGNLWLLSSLNLFVVSPSYYYVLMSIWDVNRSHTRAGHQSNNTLSRSLSVYTLRCILDAIAIAIAHAILLFMLKFHQPLFVILAYAFCLFRFDVK